MTDRDSPFPARRDYWPGVSTVEPHIFARRGWRWWLCRHCYAPKSLHPRTSWVRARPLHDTTYLAANAPHFKEGW